MSALKNSKQRDAILAELCSRHDHPTAEQLYFDLKKKYPSLSLATVYRNLKVLEESRAVRRIHCAEADRFDGNSAVHYHMTCVNCSKIVDIDIENTEQINYLPKPFGGKVLTHSLMFYGLCKDCAENQKENASEQT